MKKTSPILLSFAIVISSLIASTSAGLPHLGNVAPQQLIDESCKLASTFDQRLTKEYCISALSTAKYDRSSAKMSMHELGSIGLEVLYKNVTATKAKIDLLIHGNPGEKNPKVKNILQHCNSMYREAKHRVKDAREYMESKDYEMADRTVSMIEGDGSECEALFAADNLKSPFTRENLDTEYLGTMATLFIRTNPF
ncbi:hypothetical protein V2J09_012764 [Rumex salicifolius]